MQKRIIILLCILLLVVGCATITLVDQNGLPIPDHVVRGNIPALGTQVDFALIRYYGLKEDDEYLDMHEYLNPFETKHKIKLDQLKSVNMTVHVLNPHKNTYQFLLYYEVPSSSKHGNADGQHPLLTKELLYKGNLSRKEFNISLPRSEGVAFKAWFEMQNGEGFTCFVGPTMHYEVVGRPSSLASGSSVSNSDGSEVVGGSGRAPFWKTGQETR